MASVTASSPARASAALLLGIALCSTAQAGDRETWEMLYDALLLESADGDVAGASEIYVDMEHHLPDTDRTRAQALFWLGRARYDLGEGGPARESLRECVRVGVMRAECLELLGRLELERISVRELPVFWRFDADNHGLVHPWRYADKGTIRRKADTEKLEWGTIVDAKGDALVVGFDNPQPAPTGLHFAVSSRFQAWLQLEVEDVTGQKYRLPSDIAIGETTTNVRVQLRRLVPLGDSQPLDPSKVNRLSLLDVTGEHGGSGTNVITLDNFQIY